MSVWCEVELWALIPKDTKLSIQKLTRDFFDELSVGGYRQEPFGQHLKIDYTFTFCADGMDAAKGIARYLELAKEKEPKIRADITASIRFLV